MSAQAQSLDDQAADMAERLLTPGGELAKGGGAGPMPTTREGSAGAEGGFRPQAGGKVIDADAQKGGYRVEDDEDEVNKAGKTGDKVTSEPGRQGQTPQTGDKVTNEPKAEAGGGAGEPANVSQSDDDARARKPGQVGVSGGSTGGGMSEDEDAATRKRKSGKVGISKADDEDEDDDNDLGKSEFDAADLMKSLEVLEAVAQGSTVPAPAQRREELAKGLAEGTLSKVEMAELSELLKSDDEDDSEGDDVNKSDDGDPEDDDEVNKSISEQFASDEQLQKGYDVSPFLERHSQMTAAALDEVQTTLAKSLDDNRDRATAFNSQLAKSLMGMAQLAQRQDEMLKSLTERLENVENQPLPRRGVSSSSQALSKSMGEGEVGGDAEQLTKSDIADTLEKMAMRGELQTKSGHRVDYTMALLEQSNPKLAKTLINDVKAWRRDNNGSVNVR